MLIPQSLWSSLLDLSSLFSGLQKQHIFLDIIQSIFLYESAPCFLKLNLVFLYLPVPSMRPHTHLEFSHNSQNLLEQWALSKVIFKVLWRMVGLWVSLLALYFPSVTSDVSLGVTAQSLVTYYRNCCCTSMKIKLWFCLLEIVMHLYSKNIKNLWKLFSKDRCPSYPKALIP